MAKALRLNDKVTSKAFGNGEIVDIIKTPKGTMLEVQFDEGIMIYSDKGYYRKELNNSNVKQDSITKRSN